MELRAQDRHLHRVWRGGSQDALTTDQPTRRGCVAGFLGEPWLTGMCSTCSRANLGLKLSLRPHLDWDYYVEFVPATGWNRGLGHPNLAPPYLFVRTIQQGRPTYLALLAVPTTPGVSASVTEPRGNPTFEATLTALPGWIVEVRATKH